MKKILLLGVVALFSLGCGHVSHDDLQRELGRSQDELRQELTTAMGDGDVASLECSLSFDLARQATVFCQRLNAYCNVVEAYENHCLREGDGVTLLPPVRGVREAMEQAVDDFNAAMRQRGAEAEDVESTEEPVEPTE